MSLKDYQKMVDDWIQQYKIGYWNPHEILTRMAEEVGELAREVNHRWGPKKKKSTEDVRDVGEELGDIVFTIVCMANSLDIDLNEAQELWINIMEEIMIDMKRKVKFIKL